jgi:molybdate transport system permease protein
MSAEASRRQTSTDQHTAPPLPVARADWPFVAALMLLGGGYVALLAAMLLADLCYVRPGDFVALLSRAEIQAAIRLTLLSCTTTALLSLWVATPLAYFMSRFRFPGRGLVQMLIDVPLVLPPLVMGLSLLILFHIRWGERSLEQWLQQQLGVAVTFAEPAVVLAQFSVACGFAVQTLRLTFDQINPRWELVAMTLGCRRSQAFWYVVMPEARRGLLTAFTVAWARSLGEFGPVFVFASTTRMKTEVLSTSVYLELQSGQLQAAVALSLLMVVIAAVVLGLVRLSGESQRSR